MLWAKETSSQSHYFSATGVKVGDEVCLPHKAQPLGDVEEMPCLSLPKHQLPADERSP